jgi:MerR family redox-sensitive transcriptional activator SoxR
MVTIGEVSARAGIATSALRFYDGRGGLIPIADRRGGPRIYGDEILDRLALIGVTRSASFTVAEIKRFQSGFSRRTPPGRRWRALAVRKRAELDERIGDLVRMNQALDLVARCECPSLEDCARAIRGHCIQHGP